MAAASFSANPMVPIPGDPSSYPIAPDLSQNTQPQPWTVSDHLFQRVQAQPPADESLQYKECEVLPSDPDFAFIQKTFAHSKPDGIGIRKVTVIHNASLTKAFEAALETIDADARSFPAQWSKDGEVAQRQAVIERWRIMVEQFSPVRVQNTHGRTTTLTDVKILPLWHGTAGSVCKSICKSGFAHFGKHSFFDPSAQKGAAASTDAGYFGSGKYFSTSAKYSHMYGSRFLVLGWVAMREPYPVINDVPHPAKGRDMRMLAGHGAYQTYNAHFIPVANAQSHLPHSMEYYPCAIGQSPAWDEIVVFEKAQALPRFVIEVAPEPGPTAGLAPEMQIVFGSPESLVAPGDFTPYIWGSSTNIAAAAAAPTAPPETNGHASILKAAKHGDASAVKAFILSGADLNSRTQNGMTSLHLAAWYQHYEAVQILLQEGASPHLTDNEGRTPLHFATGPKSEGILQALLQAGVKIKIFDNSQSTPLHTAAASNKTRVLELLLQAGAEVDMADRGGETALLRAADNSQAAAMKILLQNGADPNIKPSDRPGATPIRVCKRNKFTEGIKLLEAHGAKDGCIVS